MAEHDYLYDLDELGLKSTSSAIGKVIDEFHARGAIPLGVDRDLIHKSLTMRVSMASDTGNSELREACLELTHGLFLKEQYDSVCSDPTFAFMISGRHYAVNWKGKVRSNIPETVANIFDQNATPITDYITRNLQYFIRD